MDRPRPFRVRIPVRFGDVDHAGIVYYPRFFHYFHVAFEELFRARLGRHYGETLDRRRLGFPAVAARCAFARPLRFGEELTVEAGVERLGRSSIDFRYIGRVGRARCVEATVTVACIDLGTFRARPIPGDLRRRFAALPAPRARVARR